MAHLEKLKCPSDFAFVASEPRPPRLPSAPQDNRHRHKSSVMSSTSEILYHLLVLLLLLALLLLLLSSPLLLLG